MCCFSQLSLLTEQLAHLIRIDPFTILPREVCLRVLGNLDAISLCRAAQVSRRWRMLADDNILWRSICEQHIGQKCLKCGWALPILHTKRASHSDSPSPPHCQELVPPSSRRRLSDAHLYGAEHLLKRPRLDPIDHRPSSPLAVNISDAAFPIPFVQDSDYLSTTRPWKDVYCERLTIERNWRRGRCTVRTLSGHTDGVMCLQFNERLSHPSYPILITGSYDRTARVWNLETGVQLRCLKGHTRAIRALQFDEVKLITGSMDNTIRVWDWRKGKCIRTLTGHMEGVVCLQFDSNVLASGSVDTTIKVWNLRSQEAFTLRGHTDWVNSVQLWDSRHSNRHGAISLESLACESPPFDRSSPALSPQIDPGKMLFSASDDRTIRLWDLTQRSCVRQFDGHVAQVQSLKLLLLEEYEDNRTARSHEHVGNASFNLMPFPDRVGHASDCPSQSVGEASRHGSLGTYTGPLLVSGSLDNTIKTWDIHSGKALTTLFGHIEGVWAIAGDQLRLVSGSHDRTIKVYLFSALPYTLFILLKVWNREEGRCTATLVGHRGAVTCLGLGEDKIVSGSDDGDIKIWSFSESE